MRRCKCPHGGSVQIISANVRVKAGGAFAGARDGLSISIAGCPFQIPVGAGTIPSPCLTVQWVLTDMRVKVNGTPTLSQSSVGLCLNALQVPQGTVVITNTQAQVEESIAMAAPFTSIRHPFAVDLGRGRIAEEENYAEHVEQMMFQVLFTAPGERINRPDFGCGVKRLVFAPNSEARPTVPRLTIRPKEVSQGPLGYLQILDLQVAWKRGRFMLGTSTIGLHPIAGHSVPLQ